MKTLILRASDIIDCADHKGLREAMAQALIEVALNQATQSPRHVVELPRRGALGFMPAQSSYQGLIGYKAVAVFPENVRLGINPHQGIVTLLDSETGHPAAILEGSTLTAVRTAAVSAAASDVLARQDSSILCLIGTGRQALEHAIALTRIRPIQRIVVCGRSEESANRLAVILEVKIGCQVEISTASKQAVKDADIIVTCTASGTPLLDIFDIPPGAHVNAVGACRPGQSEIKITDREIVRIFLDSHRACAAEADEISLPLASGELKPRSIAGEIGACLAGKIPGRTSKSEITLFKSVGLGIEDLFAAGFVVNRALNRKVGTFLDMSS